MTNNLHFLLKIFFGTDFFFIFSLIFFFIHPFFPQGRFGVWWTLLLYFGVHGLKYHKPECMVWNTITPIWWHEFHVLERTFSPQKDKESTCLWQHNCCFTQLDWEEQELNYLCRNWMICCYKVLGSGSSLRGAAATCLIYSNDSGATILLPRRVNNEASGNQLNLALAR